MLNLHAKVKKESQQWWYLNCVLKDEKYFLRLRTESKGSAGVGEDENLMVTEHAKTKRNARVSYNFLWSDLDSLMSFGAVEKTSPEICLKSILGKLKTKTKQNKLKAYNLLGNSEFIRMHPLWIFL